MQSLKIVFYKLQLFQVGILFLCHNIFILFYFIFYPFRLHT